MLSVDVIKEKLQSALSIDRYIHTLGVAEEAQKLAAVYGDAELVKKAEYAGLLHDCAKDYPDDMKKRFCKEYHVPVDDVMKKQLGLIHPFLGAEVAKREYGVEDEDIIGAIRWHTTGKPEMTVLEKIVFIADYIEPNRDFDGVEDLRKVVWEDLDKGLAMGLAMTVEEMEQMGNPVHHNTLQALEYLRGHTHE